VTLFGHTELVARADRDAYSRHVDLIGHDLANFDQHIPLFERTTVDLEGWFNTLGPLTPLICTIVVDGWTLPHRIAR